jgi:hypothetical protein
MTDDYRTDWLVIDLDRVVRAWAVEYTIDGREIWGRDWYIDVAQGKVVFKIDSRRKDAT